MEYFHELAGPFYFEGKQETAILMIHGFSGTPGKIFQLGKHLNEKGKFTVSGILLRGHGTTMEDLQTKKHAEWIEDALQGFDQLAEKYKDIVVIGFSMGGILACKVAQERPVKQLVTIEAALLDINPMARLTPIIKYFIPYIMWEEMDPKLEKDYELKYNIGYEGIPLRAAHEFQKLRKVVKKKFSSIECPTLLIHSLKDDSQKPKSSKIIHEKIASKDKRLLMLEKSNHLVPMGPEKELVFDTISSFLSEYN